MTREAPGAFNVTFATSKGTFRVEVRRDWAPRGADRFYNLVRNGFFDSTRFYRVSACLRCRARGRGGPPGLTRGPTPPQKVLKNWVCQFGVNGDPAVSAVYDYKNDRPGAILADDPVRASNERGTVSYSAAYTADERAVNRTTEIYINYRNNSRLDAHGFAPIGRVVAGMDVVDSFYDEYGEMADVCDLHPELGNTCAGVNETLLYSEGEQYLAAEFPNLDRTFLATVDPPHDCATAGPAPAGPAGARHEARAPKHIVTIFGVVLGLGAALFVFRVGFSKWLAYRNRQTKAARDRMNAYWRMEDDRFDDF